MRHKCGYGYELRYKEGEFCAAKSMTVGITLLKNSDLLTQESGPSKTHLD